MGTWVAWVAVAFLASAPWTLSWAYDYFCCPLELTVSLEDVERRADGKKYPPWERPRRLRGAVPPPYPNAWYKVCNSHDIPKGESRDFELLGHFFAVYRGVRLVSSRLFQTAHTLFVCQQLTHDTRHTTHYRRTVRCGFWTPTARTWAPTWA